MLIRKYFFYPHVCDMSQNSLIFFVSTIINHNDSSGLNVVDNHQINLVFFKPNIFATLLIMFHWLFSHFSYVINEITDDATS